MKRVEGPSDVWRRGRRSKRIQMGLVSGALILYTASNLLIRIVLSTNWGRSLQISDFWKSVLTQIVLGYGCVVLFFIVSKRASKNIQEANDLVFCGKVCGKCGYERSDKELICPECGKSFKERPF